MAGGSWCRRTAATVASHLRSSHRWESCLGKIAEVVSHCLPRGFYIRVSFSRSRNKNTSAKKSVSSAFLFFLRVRFLMFVHTLLSILFICPCNVRMHTKRNSVILVGKHETHFKFDFWLNASVSVESVCSWVNRVDIEFWHYHWCVCLTTDSNYCSNLPSSSYKNKTFYIFSPILSAKLPINCFHSPSPQPCSIPAF